MRPLYVVLALGAVALILLLVWPRTVKPTTPAKKPGDGEPAHWYELLGGGLAVGGASVLGGQKGASSAYSMTESFGWFNR